MDIRVASQCDSSPKHTSENSLSPECSFGLNGGCAFPNVTPFMEAPPIKLTLYKDLLKAPYRPL